MVRMAFAGFALCAFNAAVSHNGWQTSAGLLIGGACWVIALSHFNVTVQMSTPRWVVGRVLSIYQMATFGGIALGSWIWGVVADAHGAETALIAAAIAMLVGGAIGFLLPLPRQTVLNLDPLNRFKEPMLALDLKPRSGPIAIMIEYTIREDDVPEFLATMAERGRIRRRDGARNWTLAISRIRRCGSSITTRRPGSSISATTGAPPMPTPWSANASARCTAARTRRACAA